MLKLPSSILLLLLVLLLGLCPATTAADDASAAADATPDPKRRNGSASALNTLTTSCSGGCAANTPCVVVGQSSENPINCVNDRRCATLLSGRAALCVPPAVPEGSDAWVFTPATTHEATGAAPFERIGLLQLPAAVRSVIFRRASADLGPVKTKLDVSTLNLQPVGTLQNLTFDGLELTGIDEALPVNTATRIILNDCMLKSIPTQLVLGSNVRALDLANNQLLNPSTELKAIAFPVLESLNLRNNRLIGLSVNAATFPSLQSLYLDNNALRRIPALVFNLPRLKELTLKGNPIDATGLEEAHFRFLARLEVLQTNGTIATPVCPSAEIIERLNGTFAFCVEGSLGDDHSSPSTGSNGSASGSGHRNNTIVRPRPPPVTSVQDKGPSSSDKKTGLIVGIVFGAVVIIAIGLGIFFWYRRRMRLDEPHKPTHTSIGSFGGNPIVEDLDDHHYRTMGPAPLPSNESSSSRSSEYEILHNINTSGPDGLCRLQYADVFLHKLLRVSSRSELWLGEYHQETVVIKKIKANTVSRGIMRDFVEEVKLIAGLHHPRIIDFKGALWDAQGSELCAVVEYAASGALRDVTNSDVELAVPKQHTIARQIAEALAFLHEQQIVHGRLNAFNILLDQQLSAKLSIFAIFHYVRLSPLDLECGAFVAPEVQRGQQPTEKADVYAFGVVLVELDTGESPAANRKRRLSMQDLPEMQSPSAQRTGFSLSPTCSSVMKDMIMACVERDPTRRPSMPQIAQALRTGAMTL